MVESGGASLESNLHGLGSSDRHRGAERSTAGPLTGETQ